MTKPRVIHAVYRPHPGIELVRAACGRPVTPKTVWQHVGSEGEFRAVTCQGCRGAVFPFRKHSWQMKGYHYEEAARV